MPIDTSSIANVASIKVDVKGMDLESALMAVQSNRASLLETQLKDQISSVQAKNDQIAKLNALLGTLNKASAMFAGDAKADDKLSKQKAFESGIDKEVNAAMGEADVSLFSTPVKVQIPDIANPGKMKTIDLPGGMSADVTKGKLDGAIQTVKSQIDGMSNSQQMDMLRLQSLSNKRNEAFDLMTNFIKKMQDSRSSILGNMR